MIISEYTWRDWRNLKTLRTKRCKLAITKTHVWSVTTSATFLNIGKATVLPTQHPQSLTDMTSQLYTIYVFNSIITGNSPLLQLITTPHDTIPIQNTTLYKVTLLLQHLYRSLSLHQQLVIPCLVYITSMKNTYESTIIPWWWLVRWSVGCQTASVSINI